MKQWFVKNIKENIPALAKKHRIHPVLIRLMLNRGIKEEDFEAFLRPTFENSGHDPFLMTDLKKAAMIIIKAAKEGKKIRIVGDYDQDGNSATMTLLDGLMILTENLDYDIPHRVKDGYGISVRMTEKAKEDGVDLIITCDNGIAAFDAANRASELGIDMIITDHHQTAKENGIERLPKALAVVNPQREGDKYPFKSLCGAGVAYKLVEGIYRIIGEDRNYLRALLEYVAMGTVCDVVDLKDENRLFVKKGLELLNNTENYGIKALKREAGLKGDINTYALGFILGPAVNAAGRLETAKLGVELFYENNTEKMDRYAKALVALNEKRKKMTEEGYEDVVKIIEEKGYGDDDVIVVVHKEIHESIAGIIAGRVKEKYYRPCVVFTASREEGVLKGSGRSIPPYDMFAKFSEEKDLLEKFGGHKMAAGMSIREENVDTFRKNLNEHSGLSDDDLKQKIHLDSTLYADSIDFDLIELIDRLEPYGKGNPRPVFGDKGIKIDRIAIVGKEENVLKLDLDVRGRKMQGIKFQAEEDIEYLKKKFGEKTFVQLIVGMDIDNSVDICYYPSINEYRNKKNIQLVIKDIR